MEKMILSTHHHPSSIIHLMAVNTFSDYEDGAPLYLTQGELAIRVPFASVDLSSSSMERKQGSQCGKQISNFPTDRDNNLKLQIKNFLSPQVTLNFMCACMVRVQQIGTNVHWRKNIQQVIIVEVARS
jgi:hypothetical protein